MSNYIAVNADQDAIFGVGDTPEEALEDAVEWTAGDTEGLIALPCTPALRAEIETDGAWAGTFTWGELSDGTQCTVEEGEAEE